MLGRCSKEFRQRIKREKLFEGTGILFIRDVIDLSRCFFYNFSIYLCTKFIYKLCNEINCDENIQWNVSRLTIVEKNWGKQ